MVEKNVQVALQERHSCPVCQKCVDTDLGLHIRQAHGEEALREAVLKAKEQGMPDPEIGALYGVSYNTLQRIITEAYGANISILKRPKRITRWTPPDFREETTTVWSFKRRGNWATHDGRYRGNWSPYIPRNVILRYSRPGDVVLDYFVGGGTTAVEAKLLGRRCIARDINPGAVGITLENLKFSPPRELFGDGISPTEPEVSVGDARNLSDIPDNSVDLICAHPPYAGIIKYSASISGDLSALPVEDFLAEMRKVAQESLRVLKPGGKCAILIGDTRKSKHVVPIGFQTIRVFLDAGFILRELVIKRQHNCKTTGFWYTRSIEYNFLLLAHEYLPIFEKPEADRISEQLSFWEYNFPHRSIVQQVKAVEEESVETTTVWIFPPDKLESEIRRNLLARFAKPGSKFIEVTVDKQALGQQFKTAPGSSFVYIKSPRSLADPQTVAGYLSTVRAIVNQAAKILSPGDYLAIEAKDVRINEVLQSMALLLWEEISDIVDFAIKEIVVVVPEGILAENPNETYDNLQITHRYLLVYRRKRR